jgi:hypothetical protein
MNRINIDHLTEAELIDLNHRIVQRRQAIGSMAATRPPDSDPAAHQGRSEANPYDPVWKEYFAQRRAFRSGHEVHFTDPAMPDAPHFPNRLRVSPRGARKA